MKIFTSFQVFSLAFALMCIVFPGRTARAGSLPSVLPLPAGATETGHPEYSEFCREDFSHPVAGGAWDHPQVVGHCWKTFFKGDATTLSVAGWKKTLEPAGWEVLSDRQGALVARHDAWWTRIGLDRLVLVQQADPAPLTLQPPGQAIEELQPNHDIPFLTPLPGTTLKEWKHEDYLEVKGTKDPEVKALKPAIGLRYEGDKALSVLEIQMRYSAALAKSGWDLVRADDGGLVAAHYTRQGRDIWARVTPYNGAYTIEVADMGAAARQATLAKTLQEQGHVALYGIYFDTDKAALRPDSEPTLIQVQALLSSHPELKLEVQGHTDNSGKKEHNQKLSEERASSVKAWLVAHHIDETRLTARGYADTRPVADNSNEHGRALNRRVELARP